MEDTPVTGNRSPLIEARNIKKYFPIPASLLGKLLVGQEDRLVRAVDGVSLQIYQGETLGLVGESGCGKTTLGRVLARLHEPTEGEIYYRNRPVVGNQVTDIPPGAVSEREMRQASQVLFDDAAEVSATPEIGPQEESRHLNFFRLAQIIFQNPYSSLNPRKTVRNIIGVALAQRGIRNAREQEVETIRLLRRVGLSERHIDSFPHQFSGGQRQRIGIARALAVQPQFIVADEPVSALDVSIQAQVINLMQELQDEFHLTYLFIAHDLSVIYYLSDRVAVMYLGHIVEQAETQSLFDNPQHPYTQALLAAIPQVKREQRQERIILEGTVPSPIDPPGGCPFHTRCFAEKLPECYTEYPPEVEVEGHRVTCWLYA